MRPLRPCRRSPGPGEPCAPPAPSVPCLYPQGKKVLVAGVKNVALDNILLHVLASGIRKVVGSAGPLSEGSRRV